MAILSSNDLNDPHYPRACFRWPSSLRMTLMILITLTHGRYGLGQTYEILTMYYYALYYYRKATALRPYDARMWCAMAGCYKHLGRTTEAIKCYQRAETSGDREGIAFTELARLFKDQGTHPNPNLNRPRLHASAHHGAPYASAPHGAPVPLPTGTPQARGEAAHYYRTMLRLRELQELSGPDTQVLPLIASDCL
jgi:tetratricopeptide (TPR) repeat protein